MSTDLRGMLRRRPYVTGFLATALIYLLTSHISTLAGLLYEAIQLRIGVYTRGGGFFGSRLTGEVITPLAVLGVLAFAAIRYRTLFIARSPVPAGELPAPRSADDAVTLVGVP